jgi:CubicO group peptidase (beta-lactamase class C family)
VVRTVPGMDLDHLLTSTRAAMAEHGVPGLALAMFRDGEEHHLALGVTSVDHPTPVTPDTMFQTGSTTKTLTAALVVALVGTGELDLDAPVRTWVPELTLADAAAATAVTLRHLLTHMGGHDGDLFEDFGPGDDALLRAVQGMGVLEQLAPVGHAWSYSNAGFIIAGRAIEAVTARTFREAARMLVLEPLGMTRSSFDAAECLTRGPAIGHVVRDGEARVTRPWAHTRALDPAGGLVSSARDQLRFARWHLGHVPAVSPSPAALRAMQRPLHAAGGGRAAHVGLSWLLQATPGVLAHGGEANGQTSSFVLVPEQDFALTVLTNADTGTLVHRNITRWALRDLCGLRAPRVEQHQITGEELVGSFRCRFETVDVTRGTAGLELTLTPTAVQRHALPDAAIVGPVRMEAFHGGGFRVLEGALAGARGELVRDPDGAARWLRMLGRLHVRA